MALAVIATSSFGCCESLFSFLLSPFWFCIIVLLPFFSCEFPFVMISESRFLLSTSSSFSLIESNNFLASLRLIPSKDMPLMLLMKSPSCRSYNPELDRNHPFSGYFCSMSLSLDLYYLWFLDGCYQYYCYLVVVQIEFVVVFVVVVVCYYCLWHLGVKQAFF